VAAITAVVSGGRSAANAWWNWAGSIDSSTADFEPLPVGYSVC
jgi:hypothetical protein